MTRNFGLILLVIALAGEAIKADIFPANDSSFCRSKSVLCKTSSYEHINCNHAHQVKCASPTIPAIDGEFFNGKIYPLTDSDKKSMVDYHNQCRNKVASGTLKTFLPAAKMVKVLWNEELAELAKFNVQNCVYTHDCHNTYKNISSGQNIGYRSTTGPPAIPMEFANATMLGWFDEYQFCTPAIIAKYQGLPNVDIGHFTAMVTDRTDKIGCAVLTYQKMKETTLKNSVYTVCNYASTNFLNGAVYATSKKAGSKCLKGLDPKYKSLCKTI